jgi:hypothetical protein
MWCLSLYFEQKSAWSEMNFAPLICHTCRVMVGCIPHGHGLHGDTRWCLREYQQKTTQISPEMSFQYFPIASLWILQRWPNLVDAIHFFCSLNLCSLWVETIILCHPHITIGITIVMCHIQCQDRIGLTMAGLSHLQCLMKRSGMPAVSADAKAVSQTHEKFDVERRWKGILYII